MTVASKAKPVGGKLQVNRGDQAAFKFFSYDYAKLDRAVRDVIDAALSGGAEVAGPVPIPNARGTRRLCVQKSPHVYGASKEHYKRVMHKRLISIKNYSMVSGALSTLGLPAGVYVQAFHKSRPSQKSEVKS